MKVFNHHIYEYQKGLRYLILHTYDAKYDEYVQRKLTKLNIAFHIQRVSEHKMNVFFGEPECIEVLKIIGEKKLHDFSDEEDFILGIMLGYCSKVQCRRYIKRKKESGAGKLKKPADKGVPV